LTKKLLFLKLLVLDRDFSSSGEPTHRCQDQTENGRIGGTEVAADFADHNPQTSAVSNTVYAEELSGSGRRFSSFDRRISLFVARAARWILKPDISSDSVGTGILRNHSLRDHGPGEERRCR
jgi:hypothetical protein